jgi:hypothetical protein
MAALSASGSMPLPDAVKCQRCAAIKIGFDDQGFGLPVAIDVDEPDTPILEDGVWTEAKLKRITTAFNNKTFGFDVVAEHRMSIARGWTSKPGT